MLNCCCFFVVHSFLLFPLFFTGMINEVLSPDAIDSALTRLVLVNAIYFKGLWKSRFQPENTKKRTFNGADGKAYQIPMLAQLSVFRCGMLKPFLTYRSINSFAFFCLEFSTKIEGDIK